MPYQVRLTTKDVLQSRHYKMKGEKRGQVIGDEIDIKNKVLADKRKALLRVLKDKRPLWGSEEGSQEGFLSKRSFEPEAYDEAVSPGLADKQRLGLREGLKRKLSLKVVPITASIDATTGKKKASKKKTQKGG